MVARDALVPVPEREPFEPHIAELVRTDDPALLLRRPLGIDDDFAVSGRPPDDRFSLLSAFVNRDAAGIGARVEQKGGPGLRGGLGGPPSQKRLLLAAIAAAISGGDMKHRLVGGLERFGPGGER